MRLGRGLLGKRWRARSRDGLSVGEKSGQYCPIIIAWRSECTQSELQRKGDFRYVQKS